MRGDWLHETGAPSGASDGPGARVCRTPEEREDDLGAHEAAPDPNDAHNPPESMRRGRSARRDPGQ